MPRLTKPNQRIEKFAEGVVRHGNLTKAAKDAEYADPNAHCTRIAKMPVVQATIQEQREKLAPYLKKHGVGMDRFAAALRKGLDECRPEIVKQVGQLLGVLGDQEQGQILVQWTQQVLTVIVEAKLPAEIEQAVVGKMLAEAEKRKL